MNGDWESFSLGIIGTTANSGNRRLDTAHVGGSFGWDAWSVGGYYSNILRARTEEGNKSFLDGADSYGITGQYDLGGGAKIAGGWIQDYNNNNVADFGIKMSF